MIYFLTTRAHAATIRVFLRTVGASLVSELVPLTYERALAAAEQDLPTGTWCFADLDALSDPQREQACRLWDCLAARGSRLLNHPARSQLRLDLLRSLYRAGINRFEARRLGDGGPPLRFPVFLRGEHDHLGARSPLLRSAPELDAAVAALRRDPLAPKDPLVVEFCDTADADGVYRKYGAFAVGGRILPRHVFFSRDWMLKDWDLLDAAQRAEESVYLEKNPDEPRLREIFAVAGIDYGRIDYARLGGDIQVWEINTNPVIFGLGPRNRPGTWASERRRRRVARIRSATRRLDPVLARLPALWKLRADVTRLWWSATSSERDRTAVHARFAASLCSAWRDIDTSGPG